MNNLFSICGVRESPLARPSTILIGGYFIKETPENERSKIAGFMIDRFEQAEIIGKYEKNKLFLRATYSRPLSPLIFKTEFDEDKKLWIGEYSCEGNIMDKGNVELTIAPLKKEVKFVSPFYQNTPKKKGLF